MLLVNELTNYRVIRRSRRRTGIDYWLGLKNEKHLFENKARLEISGILKGRKSQINQRIKEKITQTMQSDQLNLKAVVIVIEFSNPLAKIIVR